jgi:hypothetical protein
MSTLKVNAITDLSDSPKYQPLLMTAQTASGTAVDFTGIPSWVKRITVMFNGVSTNGTSAPIIQIGDAGGVETTGYLGSGIQLTNGSNNAGINFTDGFGIRSLLAAATLQGSVTISCSNAGTTWHAQGLVGLSNTASICAVSGTKSLSDVLTTVRLTTQNGTDTFDAGTINLMLE